MTREEKLLQEIDRLANTGSVDDYTVAYIRAALRDAMYEYKFPDSGVRTQ